MGVILFCNLTSYHTKKDDKKIEKKSVKVESYLDTTKKHAPEWRVLCSL